MKKLIVTLSLFACTFGAQSQIVFKGISPASIVGSYPFTYTNPATGGGTAWGGNIGGVGFFVEDTLQKVTDDGTTADSLGCGTTIADDMTGKIAFIYRGSCNFSTKALHAQQKGAIACIIVNNVAGDAVGMAGGTDGASVTIPVIMISQATGATLKAQMDLGSVVVRLENITGLYADNIGMVREYILGARSYSTPALTAQDASEFSVPLGVYVFNRGSATQPDATVTVNVDFGGSSVYTATSTPTSMAPNDTIYVTFPEFSQATYPVGVYTVTYTTSMANTDLYTPDDVVTSSFEIVNSTYSLVPLAGGVTPIANSHNTSGSTGLVSVRTCIKYVNANAHRIGAEGIYFSASDTSSLDQSEYKIEVATWDDVFDTVSGNFANNFDSINPLFEDFYNMVGDQESIMVYVPFSEKVPFIDNQQYLFCITPSSPSIKLGYNNAFDYSLNFSYFNESVHPMYVEASSSQWYSGFTGGDAPAFGIKTSDVTTWGIFENNTIEGSLYPNPATDEVSISMKAEGEAKLIVTDIAGKVVLNNTINLTNGKSKVNINSLTTGMYIFNVVLENGTSSTFNVVKK